MTNKWPDGTPRSQGNVFDWRSRPADPGWRITSIKTECGSKGAVVTSPKLFHVFQKAVGAIGATQDDQKSLVDVANLAMMIHRHHGITGGKP